MMIQIRKITAILGSLSLLIAMGCGSEAETPKDDADMAQVDMTPADMKQTPTQASDCPGQWFDAPNASCQACPSPLINCEDILFDSSSVELATNTLSLRFNAIYSLPSTASLVATGWSIAFGVTPEQPDPPPPIETPLKIDGTLEGDTWRFAMPTDNPDIDYIELKSVSIADGCGRSSFFRIKGEFDAAQDDIPGSQINDPLACL